MPPKSAAYYKRQKAKQRKKLEAENRQIQQEHAASKPVEDPRASELREVRKLLANHQLQMISVPGDGNCLFTSLAYLFARQEGGAKTSAKEMRSLIANFIRQNGDTFRPFIGDDDVHPSFKSGDDSFASYCLSLETREEHWGTLLEVRAAAGLFCVSIDVVQKKGVQQVTPPLAPRSQWAIVYLTSFYTLGAHFNPAIALKPKS